MRERQIVRSGSGSFQSSPWKSQVNQTPAELLSVQSQSSSSQKWTRVACFKQNDVSRSELERRQFDMLISSWLTIIPISIMVWCNIAIMFWDCGLKHSSYKLYGKHATNSTLNWTAQHRGSLLLLSKQKQMACEWLEARIHLTKWRAMLK